MITQMVESARKATAPIVGIPMEGEAPFCLKRALLADSLKGLTIVDAGIQLALDGKREGMRLVVYAVGSGVTAMRSFVPMERNSILLLQWEWAGKLRDKRKVPTVKMSGRERRIAQWERKLVKLGRPKAPRHPLLYASEYTREHMREHGAELGQQWAMWKREAEVRRWISAQGRECKAGKLTTTQLYRVLEDHGLQVIKWSNVPTHRGERYSHVSRTGLANLFDYLRHLWAFCGLSRKPSYYFDPEGALECGSQHYEGWLAHLHEYKELEAMIAGVKMAAEDSDSASRPQTA